MVVGTGVGVSVGVDVGLAVGVVVAVAVGVIAAVNVGGPAVAVGPVFVAIGVAVRIGVGVRVAVGTWGVAVTVTVGHVNAVQVALQQLPSAAAPLSHTSPYWRMPSPHTGQFG